ncbi:DNA-binding protein [Lactococcus formosensis]|jgi:hypothetical protein|uniref:DNA-binding protein n=1 Tax=Lactococcus formosensis TaxID=1281486 RepID=A0A9Q8Y2B7_9LACT|nr:DNA-binding protein [Lactococcus formosensis]USJ20760.1 DNA-binding protein [Lactococcus formosensis]
MQEVKLYGSKSEISQMFGVKTKTLNNDLTEMRRLNDYKKFILRPSHKRVYINIKGYESYLAFRQEQREKIM